MDMDEKSTFGVVGAGTMGHGIAQVAAAAGFTTVLYDVTQELAQKGLRQIATNLEQGVAKGKVQPESKSQILARLSARLGIAIGMEAIRMVEEGVATPEDIDRAMELGYGHPMGPLKLTDLVGLDVRLAIAEYLYQELGNPAFRPPQLLKKMVRAGK